MIWNLKYFNKFVIYTHFKVESISNMTNLQSIVLKIFLDQKDLYF